MSTRSLFLAVVMVVMAVFSTACRETQAGKQCVTGTECREGEACVKGKCVKGVGIGE